MGDKTDPKAKENSDRLNSKIKWPFAIFFIIAIFVAISVVARFYQDKFNDLYTPALYLFSTIAQTMGALLGIGLALLYTTIASLKSSNNLIFEPVKRLMLGDELLKKAVYNGLYSIALSIIGLIVLFVLNTKECVLFVIIIFIIIASCCYAVLSIKKIVEFIFGKFILYFRSKELYKHYLCESNSFNFSKKQLCDLFILTLYFISNDDINKYIEKIILLLSKSNYKLDICLDDAFNQINTDVSSMNADKKLLLQLVYSFMDFQKYLHNDYELCFGSLKKITSIVSNYIRNSEDQLENEKLVYDFLVYTEKYEYLNGKIYLSDNNQKEIIDYIIKWMHSIIDESFTKNIIFFIPIQELATRHISFIGSLYSGLIDGDDKNINSTLEEFYKVFVLLKVIQIHYFCERFLKNKNVHPNVDIYDYISPRVYLHITKKFKFDSSFFFNPDLSLKYYAIWPLYIFIVLFFSNIYLSKEFEQSWAYLFDQELYEYFHILSFKSSVTPFEADRIYIKRDFNHLKDDYIRRSKFSINLVNEIIDTTKNSRKRKIELMKMANNRIDIIKNTGKDL